MPCDVPLKVMHTTYCHVESDPSGVKERRMKGSQRDTGQTNEAKDRTLDVSSLQCRSHNKEFQGHQDEKKRNHNPEVPLFPLPTNTTFPPHLFVFFPPSFCLSHSPLAVSSPWSGGRQRVSALTQRSLQELLWLAVLCSTVHNRLRHGELPLTAFLCCSCGFDTVT